MWEIGQNGLMEFPLSPTARRHTNRVRLARMFHWTLDYVDSLSLTDFLAILAVIEADDKLARMKKD